MENDLKEENKVPIFTSLLDSETLKLGNDQFFPGLMKEQPYDTIIQRIKLHLDPKKKVIPQRCRFLKRIQQEGESIPEYLRELKHLSINCNFGEMLGTMLRDRFVAIDWQKYFQKIANLTDLPVQSLKVSISHQDYFLQLGHLVRETSPKYGCCMTCSALTVKSVAYFYPPRLSWPVPGILRISKKIIAQKYIDEILWPVLLRFFSHHTSLFFNKIIPGHTRHVLLWIVFNLAELFHGQQGRLISHPLNTYST
ncbi:hypothetical protein LAZ67_3004370 [Cordylochernes scorpioides]|uniref:Retrotransposon gag domain-containing protein n=1 Tax=Cordylochernes scorpioides TaxID=51811 RepID=A0ABY6KCG1_9ARAC|nr:hypothetical protein LAZ67_3004370 [Cordylochernes scorpioides]